MGGARLSIRDPFYGQIESALAAPGLDDVLFEQFAAELVRATGLGTNLAVGGADNGYDFEIVDATLEPGPGVVTTSDRVTSNLRHNLERNRRNCPRAAKKTFVVTSSELTSRMRDNLKKTAQELGYVYLGAADRRDVARYIYSHPHWAQDLLGLTGQPSALSLVPRSSRPLMDVPLVGRDADIARLRSLPGDGLLTGPPGSGKTAVLAHLAAEDGWLFLVSRDMAAVANAVRELQPDVVVVDDLDDAPGATLDLQHLRKECGADFKIIVTDWEPDPQLQQMLGVGDAGAITLDQLTRDEVVAVVQSVGLGGPRPLVREIVDQAGGVPGLAVTLAQAALEGDVLALFEGTRLGARMESTVNRLLGNPREGDRAVLALGAIALAGDPGLSLEETASYLCASRGEVQGMLRRLTSGGIIRSERGRVSLRPRPLRRYMIVKAFFGPVPAGYKPLLEVTPDRAATATELVLAARVGAVIPNLLGIVIASGSTAAARYYAGSGERQARELLSVAPEVAVAVAHPALHTAPETVIPLLLTAAIDDTRALHSTPEHPLRLLKDWGNSGMPGRGEAIARKRVVVESALAWVSGGGDFPAACRACSEVLRTTYENTESDPGAGMKLYMESGMLSASEIAELAPLWDRLQAAIAEAGDAPWSSLLSVCWDLVHPFLSGGGKPEEAVDASRRLAETVIADIGRLAALHPGVLDRLNTMRRHLGDEDSYAISEDYAVLFGEHESDDWRREEQKRAEQIDKLASEWAKGDPTEFGARLVWLQREAARVGGGGHDRSPLLCRLLAERVDEPLLWLTRLADAKIPPASLLPFLDRLVRDDTQEWEAVALPILNDPELEYAAVDVALRAARISDAMWSALGPMLTRYTQTVEILCLRKQVPVATLQRLLHHDCSEVTQAAAVGMWNAEPHGSVPPELELGWEEAVVTIDDDEYWLKEMLASPALAARWLEARIQHDDWSALANRENVEVAAAGLDDGQRLDMLRKLPVHLFRDDVAAALVGDSDDVYRQVLLDRTPRSHWEDPLRRRADDTWRRFAVVALEERSPLEVAQASLLHSDSWSGPYSAYLQGHVDEFAQWLDDPDDGIRQVAGFMIEWLTARREEALAEERREAVEGLE